MPHDHPHLAYGAVLQPEANEAIFSSSKWWCSVSEKERRCYFTITPPRSIFCFDRKKHENGLIKEEPKHRTYWRWNNVGTVYVILLFKQLDQSPDKNILKEGSFRGNFTYLHIRMRRCGRSYEKKLTRRCFHAFFDDAERCGNISAELQHIMARTKEEPSEFTENLVE